MPAFPRALALVTLATLTAFGACHPSDGERTAPPTREAAVVGTPLSYGRARLYDAMMGAGSQAEVRVVVLDDDAAAQGALDQAGVLLDARPGSFAIVSTLSGTIVAGRDEVGAMYGALEICDRLAAQGAAALPLSAPVTGAPATPIRGANLYLALPEDGERGWWFLDEEYWRDYLDLLARSRINFLDLQGMYLLDIARFPNALLFFANSSSFPRTGAPPEERERNVRMLRRIVALARERGIDVGLLTNRADDSLRAHSQGELDQVELARYTREAVADLVRNVPDLRRIGFRIGESQEPASFFTDSFVAGVRDASDTMGIYTRTWLADKPSILDLAGASKDLLIEAKYNGEHIGPPYMMAGGLFGQEYNWSKYSYEGYLEAPTPYTFIFQIWGGGTHRVFRHASFDRISRVLRDVRLGPSQGFTLLATHAFTSQHDFWHAKTEDSYSRWAFRRDELEYLMFGRLSYDPTTPEQTFRDMLRERVGTDALWDAVQAAGEIVPWIQTAHTCGPDQRYFAPDLEWGGSVALWASPPDAAAPRRGHAAPGTGNDTTCAKSGYHGAYDTFAMAAPYDTARALLDGKVETRVPATEVARIVLDDAERARQAAQVEIDPSNVEARDVRRECLALADLGTYFGHKLRAATALAVFEGSRRQDYLDEARTETRAADEAWRELARDTGYIRPFEEEMRMKELGMPIYHWSMQSTASDMASIDEIADGPRTTIIANPERLTPAEGFLHAERPAAPALRSLVPVPPESRERERVWRVTATFTSALPAGSSVRVLYKSFSGSSDWHSVDATGSGATWEGVVQLREQQGYFAVEVTLPSGGGRRYPEVLDDAPYLVVPPAERVPR